MRPIQSGSAAQKSMSALQRLRAIEGQHPQQPRTRVVVRRDADQLEREHTAHLPVGPQVPTAAAVLAQAPVVAKRARMTAAAPAAAAAAVHAPTAAVHAPAAGIHAPTAAGIHAPAAAVHAPAAAAAGTRTNAAYAVDSRLVALAPGANYTTALPPPTTTPAAPARHFQRAPADTPGAGPTRRWTAAQQLPQRAASAPAATQDPTPAATYTRAERAPAKWAPAQSDANSCFFLSLVVALFSSFSVEELQQADQLTQTSPQEQLDTRTPALLVAIYIVREAASADCAHAILSSLNNIALTPIGDLAPAALELANTRLHIERAAELAARETSEQQLKVADVASRMMAQYNRAMRDLQRGLERYAPRDTQDDSQNVLQERAWRAVRAVANAARKGAALEDVDFGAHNMLANARTTRFQFSSNDRTQLLRVALAIDTLSDAMRAPDALKSRARDPQTQQDARNALIRIARAIKSSPDEHERVADWRRAVFLHTYPALVHQQQSADDTLRALLDILGIHTLLRRQTWNVSLPNQFCYAAARNAGVLKSIAQNNAVLRVAALPYASCETHDAALDIVAGDRINLQLVYPQVARTELEDRTILNITQLERAPEILILVRSNPDGRVFYGAFDIGSGRCTIELSMRDAMRENEALAAVMPDAAAAAAGERPRATSDNTAYELRAVVNWRGAADGSSGHYTTWTYEDNFWFFYNSGATRVPLPRGVNPEMAARDIPLTTIWAPSRAGNVFLYARTDRA